VRSQALREAALKANAKAATLAGALGLKIVRVLLVEESSMQPIPYQTRTFAVAQASTAPTTIEPGGIEIRATVTLTVEISQ
jgi:uncharacterized protein YggE